jgi:hypothetical protein
VSTKAEAPDVELAAGKHAFARPSRFFDSAASTRSGEKTSSLETYLVGATDADMIVDSHVRSRCPDPVREFLHEEPISEAERASVTRI